MIGRTIRAALAALTLTAAMAGVAATPAAAAPPAACPFSNTLCLFEGANFTGARFTVSSLVPNGTCVDLVSHGWGGGRAHSAINTNSRAATLHTVVNCWGYPPVVVSGNSTNPSFSYNLSSVYVY